MSWPDGGITPFHGEKGTTWEGGFCVPQVIRWPGIVEPGTKYNGIISHEDWMPTLLAAAGEPDIVQKLKDGHTANGKEYRVHLDGYDMTSYLSGETESPRTQIFYFSANAELNAVRWNDWKVHFAVLDGNITDAMRFAPNWPRLINLRADPMEEMWHESHMYLRWYADNMWLFVPVQGEIRNFLATLPDYPFQPSQALNASNISQQTLRAAKLLDAVEQMMMENAAK